MTVTLLDGLTRKEAIAAVRRIRLEEFKLRELGGQGNYHNVRPVESFSRGYTLDDRDDIVHFKVIAEKS